MNSYSAATAICGLVAFAMTTLAFPVAAQTPPIEFKGVPLGATKEELLAKMPMFECSKESCSVRPTAAGRQACGFPPKDKECLPKVYGDLKWGPTLPESYTVSFLNGTVGEVSILFTEFSFSRVVIALTEKYGAPTEDRKDIKQNRMGATFESRVVRWARPDGEIHAEQLYIPAPKGAGITAPLSDHLSLVRMETPDHRAHRVREFEEKAKASAKSL